MSDSKSQPEILVEEGLQLYGQGKLEEALKKWKEALKQVPDHHRAREYLKYVEDNRAALEESFTNAGSVEDADSSAEGQRAVEVYPEMVAVDQQLASNQNDVSDAVTAKVHLSVKREPDPEDRTPIINLNDLKASVARTKRKLTSEIDPLQVKSEERIPEEPPPLPEEDDLELEESWPLPSAPEPRSPVKTPENMSMSVNRPQRRDRRATPLTLIGGGGQDSREEFEPMEATPVSMLPDPSMQLTKDSSFDRMEPEEGLGEDFDLISDRDRATPTSMRKVMLHPADQEISLAQGMSKSKRDLVRDRAGTPARGTGDRAGTPAGGTGTLPLIGELNGKSSKTSGVQVPSRRTPSVIKRSSDTPPRGSGTMPLTLKDDDSEQVLNALPPGTNENEAARLDSMLAGATQLFEQGTYEGSLWLCERVLAIDPNYAAAQQILGKNREILKTQYIELLGDSSQVPVVLIPQHEIVWHKLDHRAGFLLSRIDGQLSFEELLDVSGMSDFEAYRILTQLLKQGVIGPQR